MAAKRVDADPIEVEQMMDVDHDGVLSGPAAAWYARGHHEPEEFALALASWAVCSGYPIPAIDPADVRQVWLRCIPTGRGSLRFAEQAGPGRGAFASTVFERPVSRGAAACSIYECGAPSSSGVPIRVGWADLDKIGGTTAVLRLCTTHRQMLDSAGPHYRQVIVPVGSEVVIPARPAGHAQTD